MNPKVVKVEIPKNSKITSYLGAYIGSNPSDEIDHFSDLGRFRKGKLSRWMKIEKIIETKFKEMKARFSLQNENLRVEIRRNLIFSTDHRTRAFRYHLERPEWTLIVSMNSSALVFVLVDLMKKKVLKTSSISLIDLLGVERIQELVSRNDEEEEEADPHGGGGGQAAPRRQEVFNCELNQFEYLPDLGRLVVVTEVKDHNTVIRIEDPFNIPDSSQLKKVHRRVFSQGSKGLKSYGGSHLLTLYSGEVRSDHLRTPAWLDPETLEETKIKGFEDRGRSNLMFDLYQFAKQRYFKLNKNKMLLITPFLAAVYDHSSGLVTAQQTLRFLRYCDLNLIQKDDLIVGYEPNYIQILKTQKN